MRLTSGLREGPRRSYTVHVPFDGFSDREDLIDCYEQSQMIQAAYDDPNAFIEYTMKGRAACRWSRRPGTANGRRYGRMRRSR